MTNKIPGNIDKMKQPNRYICKTIVFLKNKIKATDNYFKADT